MKNAVLLKKLKIISPIFQNFFLFLTVQKSAVGGAAPIVVVNQIYAAGEASSGVMPAAFNLPNDSWVRGNTGWKQVMLYNIMKASLILQHYR